MRTGSQFRGGEPTKRTTSRTICFLATAAFMVSSAYGITFQTVTTNAGDDTLTSTLNPFPVIPVSSIASTPPGQCAWINTGISTFLAANPTNGTGPSGQSWSFTWAGQAAEAQVEAGLSIVDYYPFAGLDPNVTVNKGTNYTYAGGATGEFGGAVMNLSYTPQPGAPVINNLHWVQGLMGTIRSNTIPTGLDNFTSLTTFTRDNSSPFYDGGLSPGTAGTSTNAGGGWFLDTPTINENEYESNLVASIQFQVVLAGDTQSVMGGVTNNAVTLYGGDWWGFNFTAVDVPEPSAGLLVMLGGSGLLFFRKRAGKKRAA